MPNRFPNQGIDYEKFRRAVEAAKAALRAVIESPPPHRPPLEVIGCIPEALEPVLEVARKEFPSPLVPFNFFKEILRQAITELKKELSQERHEFVGLVIEEDVL